MTRLVPSYYSVLQFVPDPRTDERINVGVVATDGETTDTRFVEDLRRAATFGLIEASALRSTLADLQREIEATTADELQILADTWRHAIQITPPQASLLDLPTLLDQIAELMLRHRPARRRTNTKTQIIARARSSIIHAITALDLDGVGRVDSRMPIQGQHRPHEVDLTLSNGKVLVAAQAISFARPASPQVDRDVDATAWLIKDIADTVDHPSLAVIIGPPPDKNRHDFQEATGLFQEINADIVLTGEMDGWAKEMAAAVKHSADATLSSPKG